PRVRAELGYPIMVTPFPQIVCTQAMMNVTGRGRYETVSDQVIRYVLEKFGHPTMPVDPDIKDKILNRPRAKELMNEPPQPTVAELRKKFEPSMPDEELLLRAVMPEGQVDAMLAAGPAKRGYNPDTRGIVELLRELTKRPPVPELSVEKPGMKVTLQ